MWTGQKLNLGVHGERPTTSCLSHGAAQLSSTMASKYHYDFRSHLAETMNLNYKKKYFMLLRELIAIYSETNIKFTNTLCG